jgi:hypothetical protein
VLSRSRRKRGNSVAVSIYSNDVAVYDRDVLDAGTSDVHSMSSTDEPSRERHGRSLLQQAIEAERAQLLQVQAVLRCLHESLLYAGEQDPLIYADVASLGARLIDESVGRLDWVRLAPLLEETSRRGAEGVKDCGRVAYLR